MNRRDLVWKLPRDTPRSYSGRDGRLGPREKTKRGREKLKEKRSKF